MPALKMKVGGGGGGGGGGIIVSFETHTVCASVGVCLCVKLVVMDHVTQW